MTSPDSTTTEPVGVDKQNPWPGLESFTEADSFFFHGRDAEAAELLRRVQREPLTLLFGRSGLGKTSLLRAGLFPLLRAADFLPFHIRLDHAENAEPLAQQVKSLIAAGIAAREFDAPVPTPSQTLWEYFHTKGTDFWNTKNRLLIPVLVFDQFEEIFTLGNKNEEQQAKSEAFLTELGDLIENRPPADLKKRIESGQVDTALFSFTEATCKIVLSFREDYLPAFEVLRSRIPSLANNRMRLEPMFEDQAFEVVTKAGGSLVDEKVAKRIVRFVAAAEDSFQPGANGGAAIGKLETDPALLSLCCRKLNDERLRLQQPQITEDLVKGSSKNILSKFYDDCIRALKNDGTNARNFVEKCLLTKSGHRDSFALDNALDQPGIDERIIDKLVSLRLLRYDDRSGRRVELAHDVLIAVIRTSRDAREQQRNEAAQRARAEEKRLEAEARAREEHDRAEREKQDKERAEALVQRAAEARAQADEIIAFLIYDLRDKLGLLGQVQLLADVNDKAIGYFEKLSGEEQTIGTEWNKAVALQSRGNIRFDAGKISEAVEAHQKSLEIFRQIITHPDAALNHLEGVANQSYALAGVLLAQGKTAAARELIQEALDLAQSSAQKENADPYWANLVQAYRGGLANVLKSEGKLEDAIKLYEQNLKEQQAALAATPDDESTKAAISGTYISLGDALRARGRLGIALQHFENSLTIRKQLAEEKLSDVGRQHNLSQSYDRVGEARQAAGKMVEALEAFNESDQIFWRLVRYDPDNANWNRNYSVTRFRLAEIQSDMGVSDFASDIFSRLLAFRMKLAKLDETNAEAADDLAEAHIRCGDSAVLYGQLAEAAKNYEQAHQLRLSLVEKDSTNADRSSRLADAIERVGDLKCLKSDAAGGLLYYERAFETRRMLAENDKTNLSRLSDLAASQTKVGDAYKLKGDNERARQIYEEALATAQLLADADPDNAQWQSRLAVALGKLGEAGAALQDFQSAVQNSSASLKLWTKLTDLAPQNAQWQIEAADLGNSATEVLIVIGQAKTALQILRAFIPVREGLATHDKKNFKRHAELARTYYLAAKMLLASEEGSQTEAAVMLKKAGDIMLKFKETVELTADQQQWLKELETAAADERLQELDEEVAKVLAAEAAATTEPAQNVAESAGPPPAVAETG